MPVQPPKSRFPIVHATRIPASSSVHSQDQPPPVGNKDAEDENNLLYQALLQRKQLEQQRVSCILHDTRVITDAMVQKQRDALQSKLVVSATGDQYVSNARYVQINSGLDPKIKVHAGMHALTPDECDVFSNLVERSNTGVATVMHNHCMSEQGMVEGFRFTISPNETSSMLPIPRKMFFRHSVVECLPSNNAAANGGASSPQVDPAILTLLFKQNEVRDRLVKIMKKLHAESVGHEADFDCMPENIDSIADSFSASEFAGEARATSLMSSYNARRSADCRDWKPEMPELLGLYHAYVKGFNKDTRHHKLFIVVSGGCHKMSDKFYNLSVDVRSSMTVQDVLESEEAYYLNRINGRSNARILKLVADAFKIRIPTMVDTCGYDPVQVASATTEAMINDMHKQRDGNVTVLSKCVDTTRIRNGVACSMHPSEGFWLFKGSPCTSSSLYHYGGAFGNEARQTSMPTCMNRMHANYSWRSKTVQGSKVCDRSAACSVENRPIVSIAKVDRLGNPMETTSQTCAYTYMDEEYLRCLQAHAGWNRDNGIIELMPIAVVYQGDSDIF